MAKESLFNIMNNLYHFDEVSVLDLFAGTGNISYEFASRGTEAITCLDQDFGCIKFINQTAEKFEMPIQNIKSDVFKFLEISNLQASIIFADPPYSFSDEQLTKIAELVFQNKLQENDVLLIVEHSKHTDLSQLPHNIHSKSYGGNMFSFFE